MVTNSDILNLYTVAVKGKFQFIMNLLLVLMGQQSSMKTPLDILQVEIRMPLEIGLLLFLYFDLSFKNIEQELKPSSV